MKGSKGSSTSAQMKTLKVVVPGLSLSCRLSTFEQQHRKNHSTKPRRRAINILLATNSVCNDMSEA